MCGTCVRRFPSLGSVHLVSETGLPHIWVSVVIVMILIITVAYTDWTRTASQFLSEAFSQAHAMPGTQDSINKCELPSERLRLRAVPLEGANPDLTVTEKTSTSAGAWKQLQHWAWGCLTQRSCLRLCIAWPASAFAAWRGLTACWEVIRCCTVTGVHLSLLKAHAAWKSLASSHRIMSGFGKTRLSCTNTPSETGFHTQFTSVIILNELSTPKVSKVYFVIFLYFTQQTAALNGKARARQSNF